MVKVFTNKQASSVPAMRGQVSIVILGAGFAGLRVVQELTKRLKQTHHTVTLIDQQDIHLYTPDLYEITSAFNENPAEACRTRLHESVATPIKNLVDEKKIRFIKDRVVDIQPQKQKITLGNGTELHYDFLVVALGSVTNYFDIPGLKEHALPLKTFEDAIAINCRINTIFNELRQKNIKRKVYITIGGGGTTGVETAAELTGYLGKLSKKYQFIRRSGIVQIVEASDRLAGFDRHDTKIILKRFVEQEVDVYLNHKIVGVEDGKIELETDHGRKKLKSDVLIWTGGVKVNPVVEKAFGTQETHGGILVDKYLQNPRYPNIFAAGDCAFFPDPDDPSKTQRMPMLAQVAYDQGIIVAKNIVNILRRKPLEKYRPLQEVYIIPIGGKYAICKIGRFYFKGKLMWFVRRFITLRYCLSILPFFKALKKWLRGNRIFVKND